MTLLLISLGFTSAVAQALLVRELAAVFYGNEALLGFVLAVWLAGAALGAGLLRPERFRSPLFPPERVVRWGAPLLAVILPAQITAIRYLPLWLSAMPGVVATPGATVSPFLAALAAAAALLPLCVFLGGMFALAARAPRAYLCESLGAVAGGTLFSLGLAHWLNPFTAALGLGALNLAAAVGGRARLGRAHLLRNGRFWGAGLLLLAAFPVGDWLHAATLRAQYGPDLVYTADSPYGRLAILRRGEQRIFYQNGQLSFETQSVTAEEVVHLPLLAYPAWSMPGAQSAGRSPERALLLGGAVNGDLAQLLQYPVRQVVVVEPDADLIAAARQTLPAALLAPLDDPRISLATDDGRRYVQRTRLGFDVVILDLPEPATGALNRFYTVEFFMEIQSRLAADGILSLRLPSAENYWNPDLLRRNASVYSALRQTFEHVLALPGETDTYLAAHFPLTIDPAVWRERLAQRGVHTVWVTPAYLDDMLTGDRLAQTQPALAGTAGVRVNRDLTPVSAYYHLALWLSRFSPRLHSLWATLEQARWWWAAIPLAVLVGAVRLRKGGVWPWAVGLAGWSGMLTNLAVMAAFQAQHGTLYRDVGLMTAVFLGGHALGLWAGEWVRRVRNGLLFLLWGGALGAGALAWALSFASASPVFWGLALLGGALTGSVYPVACAQSPGPPGRVVRVLYAADLLGGCLGALFGGALLLPLLGVPQNCLVVSLSLLAGGLLAAGQARRV